MLKIKKDKKRFSILFSADIHGNIIQFQKLFDYANKNNISAVIIGGDIAPKDKEHRTIEDQKKFLIEKLIPLIKKFNIKTKNKCKIFLIMGNDDFKSNYPILKKYEKTAGFKLAEKETLKLTKEFNIIFYSYVPLTPFIFKDWEKLDLNKENELKTRKDIRLEGIKTKNNKTMKIKINLDKRIDTIENDLRELFKKNKTKKIILVSHTPPYNTNLDLIQNKEHIGSRAIRKIIEKKQLPLTLHGHVHETFEVSGKFISQIGKSICATPSNNHETKKIAFLEFDINNLKKIERKII